MSITQLDEAAQSKPLRLWPGVLAVILQWVARFVVPIVVPEATMYGIVGGVFGGALAVLVWWLFFSRAPWSERLTAIVLLPIALFATSYVVDESIANGAMGMLLPMLAIPVLCLALVSWALASRWLSPKFRSGSLIATIVAACGAFALLRTDGVTGDGKSDLEARFSGEDDFRLRLAFSGSIAGIGKQLEQSLCVILKQDGDR
jgi:hypothetical protein